MNLPIDPTFREAVRSAAGRGDVAGAVRDVYARLAAEIDARRPVCEMSGRCCRFEEWGHRLYITTMELAVFVREGSGVRGQESVKAGVASLTPDHRPLTPLSPGCPFQVGILCGVHAIRPFGCRIFFCDPTAQAWQNEVYERLHGELKRMHGELGVPYYYVEWREGLAAVGVAVGAVSGG